MFIHRPGDADHGGDGEAQGHRDPQIDGRVAGRHRAHLHLQGAGDRRARHAARQHRRLRRLLAAQALPVRRAAQGRLLRLDRAGDDVPAVLHRRHPGRAADLPAGDALPGATGGAARAGGCDSLRVRARLRRVRSAFSVRWGGGGNAERSTLNAGGAAALHIQAGHLHQEPHVSLDADAALHEELLAVLRSVLHADVVGYGHVQQRLRRDGVVEAHLDPEGIVIRTRQLERHGALQRLGARAVVGPTRTVLRNDEPERRALAAQHCVAPIVDRHRHREVGVGAALFHLHRAVVDGRVPITAAVSGQAELDGDVGRGSRPAGRLGGEPHRHELFEELLRADVFGNWLVARPSYDSS